MNTVVIPANTIGILFSQVLRRNFRCTNSNRKVRIDSLTVIAAKKGICTCTARIIRKTIKLA
ncbi:MAG: hypothetical protein MR844_03345 [Clostridia bacterium]|nr:hypothetical protein [Clostridia bacterium]